MTTSEFVDKNGQKLLITMNRSNIVFSVEKQFKGFDIEFKFEQEVFNEIKKELWMLSNKVWKNINVKEATSFGSDYFEYYDRQFDNNGTLVLLKAGFKFGRPVTESLKLYQLNKVKTESLLFDLNK